MTMNAVRKTCPKRKKTIQSIRDNDMIQKRIRSTGNQIQYINDYVDKYFGTHVTSEILMTLARIAIEKFNLQIDRLAKRNRTALLCWYAENWDSILQILNGFNFMSSQNRPPVDKIAEVSNQCLPKQPQPCCEYTDPYDLSLLLNVH